MRAPKYFRLREGRAEKLVARAAGLERDIQNIFEANLEPLLNVRLVESEYSFPGGRMDTLGLDKRNRLVVIEYKRHSAPKIIQQARAYAKFLEQNPQESYRLVQRKLSNNDFRNFVEHANPKDVRRICIANEFTEENMAWFEESKNIELVLYQLLRRGGMEDEILTLQWVDSKTPPPPKHPGEESDTPEPPLQSGKLPNFSFLEAKVPIGAQITFKGHPHITAIVKSDTKIEFEGSETSLSTAAKRIKKRLGQKWKSARGPDHWMFDGKSLTERRMRLRPATGGSSSRPDNARHQPKKGGASKGRKTHPDYMTEASGEQKERLDALLAFCRSLGEDVDPKFTDHYHAINCNTRMFASLMMRNSLKRILIHINTNPNTVQMIEGFTRDVTNIGHNGLQKEPKNPNEPDKINLEITISSNETLERAKLLLRRAYEEAKR